MSRALENDVAAALRSGNAQSAYQQISRVFSSSTSAELLELEILGRAHAFPDDCYVLRDECAVAVSKLGLVQAFIVARQLLKSHIDGSSPRDDPELLALTAVMLLVDPEHLTAANTRKRVLLRRLSSAGGDAQALLRAEKYFLDSLLTSRLHRHTKSPTLWGHLQWLLLRFSAHGLSVDVLADLTTVVSVAGERHPRNYYAWTHARFLMKMNPDTPKTEVLAVVKKWAFQHHTDISGWTFLYFLLRAISHSDPAVVQITFEEVLKLVVSLQLVNESVWVFLRTLTASGLVGDTEHSQLLAAGKDLLQFSKLQTDKKVLQSALGWCETYRVKD